MVVSAVIVLTALGVSTGVIVFRPQSPPTAVAQGVVKPARPLTPFEAAGAALKEQAAALLDGDEKCWLEALAPGPRR